MHKPRANIVFSVDNLYIGTARLSIAAASYLLLSMPGNVVSRAAIIQWVYR